MTNADNVEGANQEVAISFQVDETTGNVELEINAMQQTNPSNHALLTSPLPEIEEITKEKLSKRSTEGFQENDIHQGDLQKQNGGKESAIESPCLADTEPTQLQNVMQRVSDLEINTAHTGTDVQRISQIQLPTHCPSCGVNLHSSSANSKPKDFRIVSDSNNSKTLEKKLADVMGDRRLSFIPKDSTHRQKYFFERTRSETLQDVKQVAQNGIETLKNRLRLSVLRENEIRMEAEMSQADKEIANVEKALAEILLTDTRQHEAMLQKDLQSAVVELQQPNRKTKTLSTSDALLREKFKSLKDETSTERKRREKSEAEMFSMLKELRDEKHTMDYVLRLEEEIRHLKDERRRSGTVLDGQRERVWRPYLPNNSRQRLHERDSCSRERDCWYTMDRARDGDVGCQNEWQREKSHPKERRRPSRSRRHIVSSKNRSQLYETQTSNRGQYKRSRTSSNEEFNAQLGHEEVRQRTIPLEQECSKQLSRANEYVPPVPPTKVDSEALRKARQEYMKETRRLQDRWHTINQER